MRLRSLVVLDLVVLAACIPGILNVAAKDDVSTAEGVIAWVSAIGLIVALLALVVFVALGVRRLFARQDSL
jgi:hypothetical protein